MEQTPVPRNPDRTLVEISLPVLNEQAALECGIATIRTPLLSSRAMREG